MPPNFSLLHLGAFGGVGRRLPSLLPSLLPPSTLVDYCAVDLPPLPPGDGAVDPPEGMCYSYVCLGEVAAPAPGNPALHPEVVEMVGSVVRDASLDLILSTAGHWEPGSFASPEDPLSPEKLAKSYSALHASCVEPAVACLSLAGRFLKPSGCIVLTGAAAAVPPFAAGGCAGMLSYGLAKRATMNVAELAATEYPTIIFHPNTVDTAANREAMPEADFGEWNDVEMMLGGVVKKVLEGETGAFEVVTEGGVTKLVKM
jgi:hypothetical protein